MKLSEFYRTPDLRNCLVTSHKIADKIMKDVEPNISSTISLQGVKIIPDIFCQDNYAYLFDNEGNLVGTFIFEGLE